MNTPPINWLCLNVVPNVLSTLSRPSNRRHGSASFWLARTAHNGSRLDRCLCLCSFGRRDSEYSFERIFVPSLVIDHTELLTRQAGQCGEEGFVVWAGSLAAGDGYVSSVVVPTSVGAAHGEVSAETTAHLLRP